MLLYVSSTYYLLWTTLSMTLPLSLLLLRFLFFFCPCLLYLPSVYRSFFLTLAIICFLFFSHIPLSWTSFSVTTVAPFPSFLQHSATNQSIRFSNYSCGASLPPSSGRPTMPVMVQCCGRKTQHCGQRSAPTTGPHVYGICVDATETHVGHHWADGHDDCN